MSQRAWRAQTLNSALQALVGVAMLVFGLATSSALPIVVGPVLIVAGAVNLAYFSRRRHQLADHQ